MKKFHFDLFKFFMCILVINLGMFSLYYKFYWDYFNYKTEYSKVFIGDSHSASLENYTQDLNTFNFSEPGDSYLDMYRKINFLKNFIRIDTIYLVADKHTVSTYRELVNNHDRSIYYSNADDFPNYYEFFKNKYLKLYIPIFNTNVRNVIRLKLMSSINFFKKNKSAKKEIADWVNLTDSQKNELTDSRIAKQFGGKAYSYMLETYLEKIFRLAEVNNIKIIGIKLPVTKIYYAKTKDIGIKPDTIFRKYNIEVLNFEKLYFEKDSLFKDQDHLNSSGAKHFIDKLKSN